MATALAVERARTEHACRFMHAYPSVDNPPSNAICRKLGFTLLGEHDFEYPPGNPMRCNDWVLDLKVIPTRTLDDGLHQIAQAFRNSSHWVWAAQSVFG